MKIYRSKTLSREEFLGLTKRPADGAENVSAIVKTICLDVKKRGDDAVREYGDLYEPTAVEVFRVGEDEFEDAYKLVSHEFRTALSVAERNIRTFHEKQVRQSITVEIAKGIECRRELRAFESVGLYIPAGSAPLPSTVLMLAVPALLAGCERIILCSPPNARGTVDPSVLVAAASLGVKEVYKAGGAQAIAAMAYGTESIPKVEKIFGPGSRYVTLAKQFVSSDPDGCAVDLIAGPSELLVIADGTIEPGIVAIDLLSQAEHDPFSQVVLVTPDESLAHTVVEMTKGIGSTLPRRKIIEQSIAHSFALITRNIDEAIEFSNAYGPEHLSILTNDPESLVHRIKHAGSVFVGKFTPVTAGDYASGTNHTLPTGGTARWYSGLTVESFQKTITVQKLTKEGLEFLAPTLITLTETEGLEAHKRAVTERLR